jgi:transketolase
MQGENITMSRYVAGIDYMRKIFTQTLVELAREDSRIVLLTADLGYTVLEPFRERFPDRFFNVGVAEQNMLGIATGLAKMGFFPFVYSIAAFASLRPFEFIRNGPVNHNLPVRIIGVGGGFEYDYAGITHYTLEDIGVLRTQPNLNVYVPADDAQAKQCLLSTWNCDGPVYYRLGKRDNTVLPGLHGRFDQSGVACIREKGNDVLLLATGPIASEALGAADILEKIGIRATVAVVSRLAPTPADALIPLLYQFPVTVTVEAHYRHGGLGSLAAEVIAGIGGGRLACCCVDTVPTGRCGTESYMNDCFGLSSQRIAAKVQRVIRNAKKAA